MTVIRAFGEKEQPDLFSPDYLPLQQRKAAHGRKKKVIVIAGPTGVGKSDFAIEMAEIIGGEIVSADSMQVYRGMDIGTAKVSLDVRRKTPHHLIDIAEISEPYNVSMFFKDAHEACREILRKDKVPIIVGGSGFYIHCFLYGPPSGPPSDTATRWKLQRQLENEGPEALYEKLQMLDPEYAATITERDRHKIVRALEIILISEKGVSSFPKSDRLQDQHYNYCCWFLCMSREMMRARVEERCDKMVAEGIIEETARLLERGLLKNSSASLAIGYRQCIEYLQSAGTERKREKFVENFKRASCRYIKKQITWFKKEPLFRFLDVEQTGKERAMEYVLQDFEQSGR